MVKTAATVREEIAVAIENLATTETAPVIKTVATVAGAPKIFRKVAIIATKEETTIVVARTSKKNTAASFNRREKYV